MIINTFKYVFKRSIIWRVRRILVLMTFLVCAYAVQSFALARPEVDFKVFSVSAEHDSKH